MRLIIYGAPRTKKNSLRRIRRGRRTFTVPSAAHEAWEKLALLQLNRIVALAHRKGYVAVPLRTQVNLRALIYRDRDVGDLGNYLAAVCDVLERGGIVANDRLIIGFDGSRMLVDKARPRVEVWLESAA